MRAPNESPRRLSPDETRAKILDAAKKLFLEEGLEALTMRRIAKAAGMATMTLYGYFPNKVALVRGVWTLAFTPLFEHLQQAAAAETDPRDRLEAACIAYAAYWIDSPDLYRVVFMIEDRRASGDEGWFVDEPGIVASYMQFADHIGAVTGEDEAACLTKGEALICALNGIAHMAVTVSEYPWAPPETYVRVLLKAVTG
jgi:AcrR family transcriptional regulator